MNKLLSELKIFSAPAKKSVVAMAGEFFDKLSGSISEEDNRRLKEAGFALVREALREAAFYGFTGDLWHSFVALYIALDENPYSLCRERRENERPEGTVCRLAQDDCKTLRRIFSFDFAQAEEMAEIDCFSVLRNFTGEKTEPTDAGAVVTAFTRKLELAQSDEEFFAAVDDFYAKNGPGVFGLSKAFTLSEDPAAEAAVLAEYGEAARGPVFRAVKKLENVTLADLIGYEPQKKKLVDNTEAFLKGRPANNALLYGDSGTGKSTSIRAIANQYFDRGLRLIQVYRHQMHKLSSVIEVIKNRNYRFILYMDDLSFEDFETEYKYLKAVIEGGLEKRPDNVLIYATSNRRHLIKETWKDRTDVEHDGDIHRSDSIEEKLSLAERFGVQIYYGKPNNDEYHGIVRALAAKENVGLDAERLHAEANKWEMSHGGVSGRTARQLIDYLKGTEEDNK